MMKILILQPNLCIGGIETSLLNTLDALKNEHEIDLFLLEKSGEFYDKIDTSKINILSYEDLKRKKTKIDKILKYIKLVFNSKSFLSKSSFLKNKKYDMAIVYHGANIELLKILDNNVNANKKISFIHGDSKFINKRILKYAVDISEKVVCVSNSCRKSLISLYPKEKDKIEYLYNIQNFDYLIQKSKEYKINYNKEVINLLSVARFGKEKGHLRLLKVIKKLVQESQINFHLHLVGNGETYQKVEKYITKNKLNNYVTLYGSKSNPYPYFIKADCFLLMSYHEAAPMVIGECSCFKLPILSTETISAKEMIKKAGVVCDNSFNGLYNGLKKILISFDDVFKDVQYNNAFTKEMYKEQFNKKL